MTDSSSMLQNQTAVMSDCLYNLIPSASRCRPYRASLPPISGASFLPGGRMINTYLDVPQTYLKFTVNNLNATNAILTDRSGACFINRLDVFGNDGSILLETVQTYNILYNYLLDYQLNFASAWN